MNNAYIHVEEARNHYCYNAIIHKSWNSRMIPNYIGITGACGLPPLRLGQNPGGHTMGPWQKNHNKTSGCQKNRNCGLRATPRGK